MPIQKDDILYAERLGIPGVVTAQEIADLADAGSVAAGSTLGLQQSLLANAGQPALTVLAVGYTNTGRAQGCSLGDGNVIEVYASGADFSSGIVLYREFMSLGEPICFSGLTNGAIITSTQGFYGVSECIDGNAETPMPLLSYGLSFKSTFCFAFRDSNEFGQAAADRGFIFVVNGPLANVIKLTNGVGVTTQGQEDISLDPWEHYTLETEANEEYVVSGTNPMMVCITSAMSNIDGVTGTNSFTDSRLVMPLTNDGITWARSGFISAPYDNTQVEFFTRDNVTGFLNSTLGTGVSPGLPVDFDAAVGIGTGANDSDYEPNGATRVLATGLISGYSGADGAGSAATPLMPVSAMSQVVAQPFFIDDTGDGGNSSVSISSPYEGTARIYSWDITTSTLVLEYTVPLLRNGVTVSSKQDQKHPASGQVANETTTGSITLVGDLGAGVVIADVPITVVSQNGTQTHVPTVRTQNGGTTTSLVSDDDETLMLGWTPDTLKAEVRESLEDNILYKRIINATGIDTWVVA